MKNQSLFDEHRTTLESAKKQTIESLRQYGSFYKHWTISFSGGKDSSAVVTFVLHAIDKGWVERPESLSVFYADTRQEIPPLHQSALGLLAEVRKRGFATQIVLPRIDKRFIPNILGRGVAPPNNNTARWCTNQIKLVPMVAATRTLYETLPGNADLETLRATYNSVKRDLKGLSPEQWRAEIDTRLGKQQRFLSLNGVRIGESAARDARIAVSCSKNGSECGQGWFQRELPDSVCDKHSPILHWRVCQVWDWLIEADIEHGFPTWLLAEVYGGDEREEINARTGCMGCPLANEDKALVNLVRQPKFEYLEPFLELRGIWKEARRFENRHQKNGERLKNGDFSKSPCRKGCLTIDARKRLFEKVLDIQDRANRLAKQHQMPTVDLVNKEEASFIKACWEQEVYPKGWSGKEPRGDEILPQIDSQGNIQPLIPGFIV